jgi:hypothetical protein
VKRKRAAAVAVALVAAVGLAAAAALTLRTASAAPTSAPLPVAYDGADGWHQGRARLPVIYIGESSVFVRTPRWSWWSRSSAQARGTLWVNTCTPTCSAGHYRTYRAKVGLWRVAVRDGGRYFTRMSLRYWHGHERDYVFRWDILPGAAIPGWNGGPS